MKLGLVAVVLLACVGCNKEGPPPDVPPDDGKHEIGDGIGTPIGDACSRLRKVGCPEGFPDPRAKNPDGSARTCYQAYTHASTSLGVEVPAVCIKAAPSIEDVRACGNANMIRVRCIQPAAGVQGSAQP